MHHTGRVVSRTELVEHLYDQDFDRDSNTIEVFVGRIRKKLGVDVIQTGARARLSAHAARCALAVMPARVRLMAATVSDARYRWRCGSSSGPPAWTSVIILFVTGIVLSSLYREAVERAFDRRLQCLSAHACRRCRRARRRRATSSRKALGEPLFELPLSGWYWQVTQLDSAKPEMRASRSLWDGGLPRPGRCSTLPRRDRRAPRLRQRAGGSAAAAGRAHRRSRRRGAVISSRLPAMPPKSKTRSAASTAP